jgi:ADP-ribose pyrophosphatase YjhB (NUDIX family)
LAEFDIGVHAIIFDEQERILLGHRRDMDLWDLPGGGLEPGELPTEGAIRETKEETGLDVEVERLFGVGVTLDTRLGFVFYCRSIGGELTPTEEMDNVAFFARQDLPANIPPRKQAMIASAYDRPAGVVFGHVTSVTGRQWLAEKNEKRPG